MCANISKEILKKVRKNKKEIGKRYVKKCKDLVYKVYMRGSNELGRKVEKKRIYQPGKNERRKFCKEVGRKVCTKSS